MSDSQFESVREAARDAEQFRVGVIEFLRGRPELLVPTNPNHAHDYLGAEIGRARALQRALFEAGWARVGWAPEVGGVGGDPLMRSVFAEAAAQAGGMTNAVKTALAFVEILGPAFVTSASADLVERFFLPFMAGQEGWCQGFSEPEAGSDLSAMRTTATGVDGGWRLDGGKIWTSYAQYAQRCLVLARTGTRESRHRGISAFLIDMDSPGLEVSTIKAMGDQDDFCQLHFDGVHIPADRIIGGEGDGWKVTMDILACERGAVMWQESALLAERFGLLLRTEEGAGFSADRIGAAYLDLYALRAHSRRTQVALAEDVRLGALSSFDKILDAVAHQGTLDLERDVHQDRFVFGEDGEDGILREDFLMSRAATIYGGTSEIQRNTVADRLLALPVPR